MPAIGAPGFTQVLGFDGNQPAAGDVERVRTFLDDACPDHVANVYLTFNTLLNRPMIRIEWHGGEPADLLSGMSLHLTGWVPRFRLVQNEVAP